MQLMLMSNMQMGNDEDSGRSQCALIYIGRQPASVNACLESLDASVHNGANAHAEHSGGTTTDAAERHRQVPMLTAPTE